MKSVNKNMRKHWSMFAGKKLFALHSCVGVLFPFDVCSVLYNGSCCWISEFTYLSEIVQLNVLAGYEDMVPVPRLSHVHCSVIFEWTWDHARSGLPFSCRFLWFFTMDNSFGIVLGRCWKPTSLFHSKLVVSGRPGGPRLAQQPRFCRDAHRVLWFSGLDVTWHELNMATFVHIFFRAMDEQFVVNCWHMRYNMNHNMGILWPMNANELRVCRGEHIQ